MVNFPFKVTEYHCIVGVANDTVAAAVTLKLRTAIAWDMEIYHRGETFCPITLRADNDKQLLELASDWLTEHGYTVELGD